jgi:hypothetical protein
MSWRERLLRAAAVLAIPAAILLVALAVDVLRVPGELEGDDVRFQAAPRRQQGLWDDIGYLPSGVGKRVLGLHDDVAYRRTVALFLRVEPGTVSVYGPELEALRGRAQFELTRGSAEDPDPRRRANLLNLLGALSLERYTSDLIRDQMTLRQAIVTFRSAVRLDPGNADAKLNLELALRNAVAALLPGADPESGTSRGQKGAPGGTGGGY